MENERSSLVEMEKALDSMERTKRIGTKAAIISLAALVLVLCVLVVVLFAVISDLNGAAEPSRTEPETEQRSPGTTSQDEAGSGTIVVNSGVIGQICIPAYDNVPANEYADAVFMLDEMGYKYCAVGEGESLTGIDVSEHQGVIDWKRVAASGVDYAMIRLGYRGYTEGVVNRDAFFTANINGALEAGLEVGVYFFSQAISVEEALEEARFVVRALEDYDITWPVVYDWEPIADAAARTADMTPGLLNDCAQAFCEAVASMGYTPALYFNLNYGYFKYDLERFDGCELWLAEYSDAPSFYYSVQMWQYTENGSVDGVDTPVDINVSFKNYAERE